MRLSIEWREEGARDAKYKLILKLLTGADASIRERYESAVKSTKTLAELEPLENKIIKDIGIAI